MAQNITLWGATYSNVPACLLPKSGGGTARFDDTSDANATASDILTGKTAYVNGTKITGTASGGGSEFVITYAWDAVNEVYEPDCTFSDVQSAYNDGKTLVGIGQGLAISLYYNDNGEWSDLYAAMTYNNDDEGCLYCDEYSWSSYSGYNLENRYPLLIPNFDSPSKTYTPTTSQQTDTITYDPNDGYNGIDHVNITINAVATGTAGTPTATKGTVYNHAVTVTPSVINTTGYITGGTKTGTGVSVSASDLVSGSQTITSNNTYDVTNLASVVVNVSGGSSKNAQVAAGVNRVNTTSYTAVSGQSLTVAKTGTYDVYWTGYRSTTSGTSGSQLWVGSSAYGSAQTTFSTNAQAVHLENVSLTQGQTISVRARARSTSYYMYVGNLTIVEQ